MSTKTYWVLLVIFAFISVISFFNVNSDWADKNHFNGGLVVIGIVAAGITGFCIYKVWKDWGVRR